MNVYTNYKIDRPILTYLIKHSELSVTVRGMNDKIKQCFNAILNYYGKFINLIETAFAFYIKTISFWPSKIYPPIDLMDKRIFQSNLFSSEATL